MIRRLALLAALAGSVLGTWSTAASADVPHYDHVFIVVLENENASSTFGDKTEIPYLANTLTAKGTYLPNYYATGHLSLDNYISMVSGQAPNAQTQADCEFYTDFFPGTPTADGQYIGQGCVYPLGVQTIATQLEGAGYTWKGYMQDMGTPCRHPDVGSMDNTQQATPENQYAARHNPFVYFHSIIDNPTCQANDVDLNQLYGDISSVATTPNNAFITPDLCNDGHDEPCPDGAPGGMKQANGFLKDLIPQILGSPGYRDRGLIIVTFDEAEAVPGQMPDASACCNEQPGPNTPNPGGPVPGPGGGKIGAVLLSNCVQPGTVSKDPYNHYSLLRSVENNFDLPSLGYAGQTGLKAFDSGVLNDPGCPPPCKKKKRKKHRGKHPRSALAKDAKHKKHKKHKQCVKKKKHKKGKRHHG